MEMAPGNGVNENRFKGFALIKGFFKLINENHIKVCVKSKIRLESLQATTVSLLLSSPLETH